LIPSWHQQARRELMKQRRGSSMWSYRCNHVPSVEPTALVCLSLIASGDRQTTMSDIETSHEAARWLTVIQRSDGSLPVSEGLPSPGWTTPYALMLWSELSVHQEAESRAQTWLLGCKGEVSRVDNNPRKVIGHDPSLVGWPWVEATHSWLEPTALAILAVCRVGLSGHPRVKAGVELILDRALEAGGWNYGNTAVFGTELRPQPGPTGLALLALAAVGARSAAVTRGLTYLCEAARDLRSPVSLGWGILGLRAHGAAPEEAENWLARACSRCIGKPDAAMGLALLLLASSEPALRLLIPLSSARSR
jgi:hypothetical protein